MKGNTQNRKFLIWFWILFALPFVLVIVLFIMISNGKLGPMPSFSELENPQNNLAAEVYSEDGVLLGKYYFKNQNRTWTEYKEISPYVIDALVATEDIRFYRHSGWRQHKDPATGKTTLSERYCKSLTNSQKNQISCY
jgi:penicillin-binding protein 1A